jgi:hypothetical protein
MYIKENLERLGMRKYIINIVFLTLIVILPAISLAQNGEHIREDHTFTVLSEQFGYETHYDINYDNDEIDGLTNYYHFGPFGVQRFYTFEIVIYLVLTLCFLILLVVILKNDKLKQKIIKRKKHILALLGGAILTLFCYCYYISSRVEGVWVSEDGQFEIDFHDKFDIEYIEWILTYVSSPNEICLVRSTKDYPRELKSIRFLTNDKIKYYFSSCGNTPPMILIRKSSLEDNQESR